MKRLLIILALASTALAHPGAGIAVMNNGRVFFVDTGGGIFSIDRGGRVVRHDGPAFHWFALDPQSRFANTRWPYISGAEFRSAGGNPTLVMSSDFPVTVGRDGKFYYPEGGGGRIRIVGLDPSGTKTTLATLPAIQRGGETITWLNGLAAAADWSLYYSEDAAVRKIDRSGRVSTIAEGVDVPNCTAIPGTGEAGRPYLRGLAVAADGSVYVAASACGALLKIDPRGTVSTVLRTTAPWSPTAVAIANGEIYVLEYTHTEGDDRSQWMPRVRKISRTGAVSLLGASKR